MGMYHEKSAGAFRDACRTVKAGKKAYLCADCDMESEKWGPMVLHLISTGHMPQYMNVVMDECTRKRKTQCFTASEVKESQKQKKGKNDGALVDSPSGPEPEPEPEPEPKKKAKKKKKKTTTKDASDNDSEVSVTLFALE